jgi:hypothetical protein
VHPWFRPLHRRVLTVAFCAVWLAYEAWEQPGSLWFWLVLGFTVYAVTTLLIIPARLGPDK